MNYTNFRSAFLAARRNGNSIRFCAMLQFFRFTWLILDEILMKSFRINNLMPKFTRAQQTSQQIYIIIRFKTIIMSFCVYSNGNLFMKNVFLFAIIEKYTRYIVIAFDLIWYCIFFMLLFAFERISPYLVARMSHRL